VRIDLFFAGAPAKKVLATKNRSPSGWAVATKLHHRGRCCVAVISTALPPADRFTQLLLAQADEITCTGKSVVWRTVWHNNGALRAWG
jgi:hypothetical protein